jgi:hypothetical protein
MEWISDMNESKRVLPYGNGFAVWDNQAVWAGQDGDLAFGDFRRDENGHVAVHTTRLAATQAF